MSRSPPITIVRKNIHRGIMLFKPFLRLWRNGRLSALLGVVGDLKSFYRLSYLAAAGQAGLLERLASGPATIESLAEFCGARGQRRDALEAWLQLGVRLKLLGVGTQGYTLLGMARKLAQPENDPVLAMTQEVADLHHKLITRTLPKIRAGELWSLSDQRGDLIARSSLVLEPFQSEIIRRTFPSRGPVRLLEIGCGSGIYLRYAAERNPSLTAVGVELQKDVAEMAQTNLRAWGLDNRTKVELGDIREKTLDEPFDIATLYNNIYYFPVEERLSLLRHIKGFLKPRGFLLLTTLCQGGSLGAEALNLWGAATRGAGRLPGEDELVGQLREAGYKTVTTTALLPNDKFIAFQAFRG